MTDPHTSSHNNLIETRRDYIKSIRKQNWTIKFGWVKAHSGIPGNEMADQIAKDESMDANIELTYNKKPKCTITIEIEQNGLKKWEQDWANTTNGRISKNFFPTVQQRLKLNIILTPNLTAFITEYGKTMANLHRFGIIEDPTCSCLQEAQTVDHLIYSCTNLKKEQEELKQDILKKQGTWPVTQEKFMTTYIREFKMFIDKIDFTNV